MLRRMCWCVYENETLYTQRLLTGKISHRTIIDGRVITTLKCTRCGHLWHYSRRIKR